MALKNKYISALTIAVAFFAFSTFVSAQVTTPTEPTEKQTKREWRKGKGDGFKKGFRHGGMMRGLRGIELSDTQKEQIRTIREANRPTEEQRLEMRTLRIAKRDGNITEDQKTRLQTIKQESRTKGRLVHEQIKAILTPEQLQQIEQKKVEMKQRFEQRRQMRDKNRPATETEKKDN